MPISLNKNFPRTDISLGQKIKQISFKLHNWPISKRLVPRSLKKKIRTKRTSYKPTVNKHIYSKKPVHGTGTFLLTFEIDIFH